MVMSLYFLVMKSIEKISISNNIVELIVLFSGTIIIFFLMISPINASVLLVVLSAVNTMLFTLFLLLIKNGKKTNTLSGNF